MGEVVGIGSNWVVYERCCFEFPNPGGPPLRQAGSPSPSPRRPPAGLGMGPGRCPDGSTGHRGIGAAPARRSLPLELRPTPRLELLRPSADDCLVHRPGADSLG